MSEETNRSGGFGQVVAAQTLASARRGDMQAFAELFASFSRPCYNLALRMLGNSAQAEDIVQEVFLKMMDMIGSYRGDAPFGAWLKRLTANATIDQLRGQRHWSDDDAELALSSAAATTSPDGSLDVLALLQRLPPRARTVIVLHELEGYTHRELAELFGQTESYSKSVLARALKRLNALVTPGKEWEDLETCLSKS